MVRKRIVRALAGLRHEASRTRTAKPELSSAPRGEASYACLNKTLFPRLLAEGGSSLQPILSVIIFSQDDMNRIQEVMDSVVRQKVNQSFEIILVNSGKDGTAEFVRNNYPDVRVIHLQEPAPPARGRPRLSGRWPSRGRRSGVWAPRRGRWIRRP